MNKQLILNLIIIVGLTGCKNLNDSINLTLKYSKEDLIEVNLPLLEVKDKIHPILDSLIITLNECEKYQNLRLGFIINTYQDSSKRLLLHIENTSKLHELDYTRYDGVFFYKGYQFSFSGVKSSLLFKDLDKKVKLFPLKKEKLIDMYDEYDEFFYSSWEYIYDDGSFKCIGYRICESQWQIDSYPTGIWH